MFCGEIWKFIMKQFIKKFTIPVLKKIFGRYSINMPNSQQNTLQNETGQIEKEIDLL